jgi:hypothetical protein
MPVLCIQGHFNETPVVVRTMVFYVLTPDRRDGISTKLPLGLYHAIPPTTHHPPSQLDTAGSSPHDF